MSFICNLGVAFQNVVQRHGDRTALLFAQSGERVTYAALYHRAEQIAHALWLRGLRSGQVLAMFHNKSADAYATMLACVRLGVIYTNLDPDSPWERLQKILTTCNPRVVVNTFEHALFESELHSMGSVEVLGFSQLTPEATTQLTQLPPVAALPGSSPAYIMFTSGSTGVPKGAVMSHANVLWFIQWAQSRFEITCDDVLTNVNPIYFDNSVFDFYTALFTGATLAPFSADQVKDTRLLVRLVEEAKCSVWFSVPSLLVYLLTTRALGANNFASVRRIIFGGEGFPKPKLKQLYDMFGQRATLENVYGPTECTCICSAKEVVASDFDDMQNLTSLGFLAPNFDYEILADADTPGNPDVGELFLCGPQVGLGYYNDPARTSKMFIQNPHHSNYADVGYRTGDLVQRDAHGHLHFKGRSDFQIKHMGYRIELEEVEAALSLVTHVDECAVVYERLQAGMGQLVAFVVTRQAMQAGQITGELGKLLPHYMVPRRVEFLEVLPKNANGKIDRRALLLQLDAC